MATPYHPKTGMKVFIDSDGQSLEFMDTDKVIKTIKNRTTSISNHDYEVEVNNRKRTILILRKEYVGLVVSDLRNIMKYTRSSQFVDSNTKKSFNPRVNK